MVIVSTNRISFFLPKCYCGGCWWLKMDGVRYGCYIISRQGTCQGVLFYFILLPTNMLWGFSQTDVIAKVMRCLTVFLSFFPSLALPLSLWLLLLCYLFNVDNNRINLLNDNEWAASFISCCIAAISFNHNLNHNMLHIDLHRSTHSPPPTGSPHLRRH